MSVMNREQSLSELEVFYQELKRYQAVVFEEGKSAETEAKELRDTLVRKAGVLKPVVETLVGHRVLFQFGQPIDVWGEGLRTYRKHRTPGYFVDCLGGIIDQVNEAIGKLGTEFSSEVIALHGVTATHPRIFIAHGGHTHSRDRLELFLWRNGYRPIILEEMPSLGLGIDAKVDHYLGESTFAVIFAEADGASSQDERLFPRLNIIDEIARVRRTLGNKFIVLLETGLSLPSNETGAIVWERFTSDTLEHALAAVERELDAHAIVGISE